jgi:tRNA (guanine26-N2/guanine27-N2)-dimethyltransferase
MWHEEGAIRFQTDEEGEVFYNPKGSLSRTVGVLALRVYRRQLNEPLVVADAFTGAGVRFLRYLKEASEEIVVFANDANERAVEVAKINAKAAVVLDKVKFYTLEANRFFWMLNCKEIFPHFVDIDVFGSPSPFLDSALFAVRLPGLLYVTFTDLAPFCGVKVKATIRSYGAFAGRSPFCHETGLRTALWSIIQAGGRHGLIVYPLISFFDGHSFRILVRVDRGRESFPHRMLGWVLVNSKKHVIRHIRGANLPPIEPEIQIFGPLWIGDMHDAYFLEALREETNCIRDKRERGRIQEFLGTLKGEIGFPPYFYSIPHAADKLDVSTPPTKLVIKILKRSGWRAVRTHFRGYGVKTDAPYLAFLSAVKEGARRVSSGHQ